MTYDPQSFVTYETVVDALEALFGESYRDWALTDVHDDIVKVLSRAEFGKPPGEYAGRKRTITIYLTEIRR